MTLLHILYSRLQLCVVGMELLGFGKKTQTIMFSIFILLSFHFDVDEKWYMLKS